MSKPTLTDAQRVVLAAAGTRETGLVLPLPKSLKKTHAALDDLLRDLLAKGSVTERIAQKGEGVWSTSESEGRKTLVITPAGLAEVEMAGESGQDGSGEAGATPKQADARRPCGRRQLDRGRRKKAASMPGDEWKIDDLGSDAGEAGRAYLATLDDAAFGAASAVTPEVIALFKDRNHPEERWLGLSEQLSGFVRWIVCRFMPLPGLASAP